ncbi:hypothetical protein GCK72_012574 [Caenorhabditis remanei]|uniref:Uncharacterized protein n=1 Tax=Caenorhabditis remanei TaxID=31234 RepID=A0A6A5GNB6_CAERE|nr:hypothetical protein GCK72_012574 [Caenorhabditis remanei]KAF1756121.1 hypothetical protein GCK72_012574 [Caenorhabditis remanei]
MATSYLTESLAGPTSARGSSYSFSYESHYDNPPEEEYEHFTNDDGVHQMQKPTIFSRCHFAMHLTASTRNLPFEIVEHEYLDPSSLGAAAAGSSTVSSFRVIP